MNLLAHAVLAAPGAPALLGGVLADFLHRNEREGLPAAVLAGMAQHQRIDAFTDAHPLVRQGRARIGAPYRRYAGILIDIFHDHLLAAEWEAFSPIPLDEFVAQSHRLIRAEAMALPAPARDMAEAICSHELLLSCRSEAGVERTLGRVEARLAARSGRTIDLVGGLDQLRAQRQALLAEFREFFPQLQRHVREQLPPAQGGQ